MKIKKVTANTMPEAMVLIKKELGPHAVILHSKTVQKGGFMGLFRKKQLEVVAAIDGEQHASLNRNNLPEKKDVVPKPLTMTRPEEKIKAQPWKEDLDELKNLVKELNRQTRRPLSDNVYIPSEIEKVVNRLTEQELDSLLIDEITNVLIISYKENKLTEKEAQVVAKKYLLEKLASIPFGEQITNSMYTTLIGPTGAGKTTTLAKLAAKAVLQERKKIAFLTTDTYRIAAIEQLKTYAQLLSVPVEVIYKEKDRLEVVDKLQQKDQIFIDTAGRNYREGRYLKELLPLLPELGQVNAYVTFSATGKQRDWEAMLANFTQIPEFSFIFTKLDETEIYGSIYNLVLKYDRGVSYITNGQDVPDDIQPATKEHLIDLILG
ncbi:flagellar biosynthesis protein FlhF [Mangrovibacillus cuniculi]|uniref:Flagellar biosynthesis protein FlhF n=1 Tax=Mangrovibacillus cuniculi TaxID=2593652 RepID=A0A7S8CAH8_9BACI|nr:flagellar biosynthesis protein FlhF [Mangrovibacillus cuniculi]QPC46362.1 flagellar biosynthesis protein FlhF [Mangrovibacillus cuniculi]